MELNNIWFPSEARNRNERVVAFGCDHSFCVLYECKISCHLNILQKPLFVLRKRNNSVCLKENNLFPGEKFNHLKAPQYFDEVKIQKVINYIGTNYYISSF